MSRGDSPFPPDVADARARVGAAYRRLGHAISGHLIHLDELDDLADTIEEWVDALDGREIRDRVTERPTGDWGPAPVSGERMYSFDERPVSGRSAPLGFDVDVWRDGDEVVGRLTLGKAHEGAPGRSHGGVVAALFDDLFGFVLTIEQQAGFTGEIGLRYEAATPIGEPLECRVRLDRRDGRKMHMTGELSPDGDPGSVFARSWATFIAIDPDRFRALSTPGVG